MKKHHQIFSKSAKLLGAICSGLLIMPAIPPAVAQQPTSTPKVNPCPRIFYEEPHNSRVVVPQGCEPNALTKKLAAEGSTSLSNAPRSQAPDQITQGALVVPNSSTVNQAPYNPSSDNNSQSYNYSSQRQSSTVGSGQNMSRSSLETETYTSSDNSVSVPTSENIPKNQNYPSGQQRQSSVIAPPLQQERQAPNAMIATANGKVSVRLVNNTAAPITYQAVGDTAPRTLQGKSEVILQDLSTPTTVTFQRQDNGLLMVNAQSSSEPGILEVGFRETTNLEMDKRAMTIQRNGAVFLN